MMSDNDIKAIDKLIEERKPTYCLEWGSGNSTIYFTKHKSIKKWISIEKSKRWYGYVKKNTDKDKVELLIRDTSNYLDVDGKYDLILIDGDMRNECLKLARKLLNPNGIVLLHDTARNIYDEGIALYKNKEILTKGTKFTKGAKNGLTKLWLS